MPPLLKKQFDFRGANVAQILSIHFTQNTHSFLGPQHSDLKNY